VTPAQKRGGQAPRQPGELFSTAQIAARIDRLAGEMLADPRLPRTGPPLLAVCILRGGFMFTADLLRALALGGVAAEVDFLRLGSYGEGMRTAGKVRVLGDLETDVTGRSVLLIDDILDSGHTLAFARSLMLSRGAAAVLSCVLLDKKARREAAIEADFVGFDCPDRFVVGYGMDLAGTYRALPYIGTLD
jgi:hypoxanthine phosphoribosyltransferase